MSTITFTITVDLPDGLTVDVATEQTPNPPLASGAGVPEEVLATIRSRVPSRYREWVERYVDRCVVELGCEAVMPEGERRLEYLNLYPPPRCRHVRVAGVTYSSSRTAVYIGPVDLKGFDLAQKTLNSGTYAYPKLPHLESAEAVEEAIRLTERAIARTER